MVASFFEDLSDAMTASSSQARDTSVFTLSSTSQTLLLWLWQKMAENKLADTFFFGRLKEVGGKSVNLHLYNWAARTRE